jgi:hypothetical protein
MHGFDDERFNRLASVLHCTDLCLPKRRVRTVHLHRPKIMSDAEEEQPDAFETAAAWVSQQSNVSNDNKLKVRLPLTALHSLNAPKALFSLQDRYNWLPRAHRRSARSIRLDRTRKVRRLVRQRQRTVAHSWRRRGLV